MARANERMRGFIIHNSYSLGKPILTSSEFGERKIFINIPIQISSLELVAGLARSSK
jgi:hypothetical protein